MIGTRCRSTDAGAVIAEIYQLSRVQVYVIEISDDTTRQLEWRIAVGAL